MSKEQRSRGAQQSKTRFTDKFASWWQHHLSSCTSSFTRLLNTPFASLMTSMVVAIALALPVGLFVMLNNVQSLGDSWDARPKVSVFLNVRAKQTAIDKLQSQLQALPGVDSVDFISPDQALQDFLAFSGFGTALDGLESNPLPPTFVITPISQSLSPEALDALAKRISEYTIVDEIDLDMDWVRRLRAMLVIGKKIVLVLAGLLVFGVLLALGNTIRLAIESRRDEIVVVKLVGGTDGFVRRPFLYSGAWYGFLGGILACILVSTGHFLIADGVRELARTYQSDFVLVGLDVVGNLTLVLASTILGLFGAALAVGRHLSDIEPT